MLSKTIVQVVHRYRWFLIPLGLVCLNALLWTTFAAIGGNPDLHSDSAEAYVWGREFQLGYYKHPPFWAWLAGVWFSVFPHKDWAFFLLSEANASLGILGTWALLGRLTKGPERLAGTLLLLFTTLYSFNALRFNANTIQLSIWPWTMYFFVLSIENKTVKSGLVLGLMAGIAMLSKYFAALLLVACLCAALVHRDRRQYFRSKAPWVGLLVLLVVTIPHIIWVVQHNYQPFAYAADQIMHPKSKFFYTWTGLLVACLLYHIVQLGIILAARFKQNRPSTYPSAFDHHNDRQFIFVLALVPIALTLVMRVVGFRMTPHYIIPLFSLTPFLLLILMKTDAKRVTRICQWGYGLMMACLLIAAPLLPAITEHAGEPRMPLKETAQLAKQAWAKAIQKPLSLVSGTEPYSEELVFYSPGKVSEYTDLNPAVSPWVTEQRVKEEGLLVICIAYDSGCFERTKKYEIPGTQTIQTEAIAPKMGAASGRDVPLSIIIIPPEGYNVAQVAQTPKKP